MSARDISGIVDQSQLGMVTKIYQKRQNDTKSRQYGINTTIHPLSLVLAGLVWLWSNVIGEEEPPEPLPVEEVEKAEEKQHVKPLKSGRMKRDVIPTRQGEEVSKAVFLREFKEQAELDLMPCLKRWAASPQRRVVTARISKQSKKLQNIHILGVESALPCVLQNIRAMSFPQTASRMRVSEARIQFRLDW